MFVRASMIFAILFIISQARVKASTSCGDGTARCCEEDSSQPGSVNDEECQSYSEPCNSGYLASCCYIVSPMDYYYCNQTGSS
ncbi:hypothetical protein BD769DRAFT_856583 [Suillus cothurnatus]|nr:hypothetical protein BD769DRAFT_856583 [Suillus cothurnatus]